MDTITPPLLNLASLETTCPRCRGDGTVENPAWQGFDRKLGDARLFTQKHGPEFLTCSRCNGLGTVPTEMGRTLMRFYEKYMPGVIA